MSASNTIKLQDTSPVIGNKSRLESFWLKTGFKDFHGTFRKGVKLPAQYQSVDSLAKVISIFHLKGIGFGNWLTQEDRYNYVCALIIALYDLDKVLRFGKNVGLNKELSFSFGARGKGGALAHFEPGTFIINVTRYSDDTAFSKASRFALTGGAGSVAHEYGHALDYYFGIYVDQSKEHASLSGGHSLATRFRQNGAGPLRFLMDELLEAVIWRTPYKVKSAYYQRLEKAAEGDYWFRRCEIFARCFESYVQYKLHKAGITNTFLNDTKYEPAYYPTTSELQRLAPYFDNLVAHMRQAI